MIFTEPGNKLRDNVFKISYAGTILEYQFNTFNISLQDDHALKKDLNPFALIVLIAKQVNLKSSYKDREMYDQALLESKLEIANLIFGSRLKKDKEMYLIFFLTHYIKLEFRETIITFERHIQLLTHKSLEDMTMQELLLDEMKYEGKQEGIRIGKKIKTESIVNKLIAMHFASDKQIAQIAEVRPGYVRKQRIKMKNEAGQA